MSIIKKERGEVMIINNISEIDKCISCNGTGKIKCDCGTSEESNKKCLTCNGEGDFECPLGEGKGKI